MKNIVTLVLLTALFVLGFHALKWFRKYEPNHPAVHDVAREFEKLVDAWHRADTNAVRSLCVPEFDPYSDKSRMSGWTVAQSMAWSIEHFGATTRPLLYDCGDDSFVFFPSGKRSLVTPGYTLGAKYVYRRENGVWKFTGIHDSNLE